MQEFVMLMTQPALNMHDPCLRRMAVDSSMMVFDVDYLDVLVACFFLNYSQGNFTQMCYIAESVALYTE